MRVIDIPVPHSDGSFVSERITRIVELIREYSSDLDVRWIHPDNRDPGDAAFCIVERTREGWRTVLTVQTEEEFDQRVLARVIAADGHKVNVKLAIQKMQAAEKALKKREHDEVWGEARDKAAFLIKTPLHSPRIDGKTIRT